jgi:hypothetical protein
MKRQCLFVLLLFAALFAHASPRDSIRPKIYHHNVKLSLVSAVAGDLSAHYEHFIWRRFSIEGGVGLTFSNILTDYFDVFTKNLIAPPDRYGVGFSFKGQLRYYPLKAERPLVGSYLALEFGQRNHVLRFDYTFGGSTAANFATADYKLFQTAVLMGVTENGDDNGHWMYDFSVGFGFQKTSIFNAVSSFIVAPHFKNITFAPRVLIGLKVCWGW